MATINNTRLDAQPGVFQWEAVTGSDVGDALELPNGGALLALYAFGTFGDTLTIQGSIDGVNWFTLLTAPSGGEVTFTANGYAEVSTAVKLW